MMAGHNEAFFLAAMQIKSKNGTIQSNGGEEQYSFTFKGRKQLMEPCTHQNTDRCGSSSKPRSGSLHCPQSPAAMHIYTVPCRSLPIEKKIPMATYSSFMMGVHNSIYKNCLFHINTCIWTHKLWICGRYHRCLRHRIFLSADHASQELLRQPQHDTIVKWWPRCYHSLPAAVDNEACK